MLCNVTCVFTPPYLQSEFQTSSGLIVKHKTGLFFLLGGVFSGASNFGKNNVQTQCERWLGYSPNLQCSVTGRKHV